ncbi:MAG: hypothetical protein V3U71_11325 [Cocleimonas sp.]
MSLENEIRKLLNKICIDLGFCLPPSDIERIVLINNCETDELVRDIFIVEGLNPDLELSLFREVKAIFIDHLGEYIGVEEC